MLISIHRLKKYPNKKYDQCHRVFCGCHYTKQQIIRASTASWWAWRPFNIFRPKNIGWERERDGVRKTVLSKRRVNSIGKKKKDQKLSSQVFFALDRSKITITTTTSWLKNWARDCELWVLWAQVLWFKMSMANRKGGIFLDINDIFDHSSFQYEPQKVSYYYQILIFVMVDLEQWNANSVEHLFKL